MRLNLQHYMDVIVGGPYQGQGVIDHYNIEIQKPSGKSIENIHVVPTENGNYTWWGKDGNVKNGGF